MKANTKQQHIPTTVTLSVLLSVQVQMAISINASQVRLCEPERMGIEAMLEVNSIRTMPFSDQRYVVTLSGLSYVHLKTTVDVGVRTISP